jgi:hypothetical protein
MGRRNSRHAVTYLAAILAALGCLYGCSDAVGPSETNAARHANAATDDHISARRSAPAGSQARATAAARQVLRGLVVPAGTRQLTQRPLPARLGAPALALSAARSVDVYRLYRLPLPIDSAAAFLRSHLPAGLVADGTGQFGTVDSAPATIVVSATPRRLPAGIYAMELVDTIVPATSGSSLLRSDVEVIWYPARSGAEDSMPGSYQSVRVTMSGLAGAAVTTASHSVIDTIEALLSEMPAAPPMIRSCPGITVIYRLTLDPSQAGQPAVVISTGGCETDDVSVGGRQQPALWDQGNRLFLLARSLLGPETRRVTWVSPPPLKSCRSPVMQTARPSTPCLGKPKLAPRIPT